MKYYFTTIFFGLLLLKGFSQTDTESAKSVVKVIALFNDNKLLIQQTGWCWNTSSHIVTTLSSIAGATSIEVINNNKNSKANIVSVLKFANLALLKLETELNLAPLGIGSYDPTIIPKPFYSIWGFPNNIEQIQGDEIRFAKSLDSIPTLGSILSIEMQDEISKQGYPSLNQTIHKTNLEIFSGQEGSPVFNSKGSVVGIAQFLDSELPVSWITPVTFVADLLSSKEDIDTPISNSIFNKFTSVDSLVANQISNSVKNEFLTVDYESVISTLTKNELKVHTKFCKNKNTISLINTKYDLYTSELTNSAVPVPSDTKLLLQDGWYYAHNSADNLHFYALPFDGVTYENAVLNIATTMKSLMDYFPGVSDWKITPKTQDIISNNPINQTSFYEITRSNDMYTFCFLAKVKGPYLLVSATIYNNLLILKPNYANQVVHFYTASKGVRFLK